MHEMISFCNGIYPLSLFRVRSTRVYFISLTFSMRNIFNDRFTLKIADIFDVYVETLLLLFFALQILTMMTMMIRIAFWSWPET